MSFHISQRQILIEARDQFAMYAQQHRQKASRYTAERLGSSDSSYNAELDLKITSSIEKAKVNEEMVARLQDSITNNSDVLATTAAFVDIAYADGISDKNRQTQLGVHFEEVAEMCDALGTNDSTARKFIDEAQASLVVLGNYLKDSTDYIVYPGDRRGFLDAVADQLVTATLCGVLHRMDVVGALKEVNRSNYSKLVDGVMTKDPVTAKWIKGPNYRPPNLRSFY